MPLTPQHLHRRLDPQYIHKKNIAPACMETQVLQETTSRGGEPASANGRVWI